MWRNECQKKKKIDGRDDVSEDFRISQSFDDVRCAANCRRRTKPAYILLADNATAKHKVPDRQGIKRRRHHPSSSHLSCVTRRSVNKLFNQASPFLAACGVLKKKDIHISMKLAMLATMLAAVLVLGVEQAAAAPADSSLATGRRLLHSSNPTSHTKSMDSWLRWLLFHSRLGEKEKTKNAVPMANSFQLARTPVDLSNPKQQKLPISMQGNNSNDDDDATSFGDEDFVDEEVQLLLPEGRQAASKRQPDDYGHMRYGKRDFDDYGHMRFGRR